jgi:hypothetical protein
LDQCDGIGFCRLFVVACFFSDMGGKCAIVNTQYFSHDLRIAGKQKSKLKREAQYPLPNWLMGQHIINQQGGALCHSPRTAARTKPSAFTTERNQVLMVTIFTTYSQKPIFQTTALEVLFKF